jgi:hypothetical protein
MNLTQKISQMTPKGSDLQATDLVEVSTLVGGSYVTKSITGQDIIDAAAGSGVTDVTGTSPIVSTGGTTPDISIRQSSNVDDGYLSASDWNTFNNKQNALTLTTTGTSGPATLIADTLNIPQYSGGGGGASGGFNTPVPFGSGLIYSNIPFGSSNVTVTAVSNTIYLMPFIPAQTFTTSNIRLSVATGVLSTSARFLIYSHSVANGLPDTLLYESADLNTATTGIKTAITSQTFTAGTTYWLGFYANGIPAFNASSTAGQLVIGFDTNNNIYNSISRTVTYGSAPTTWGTTHTKTSNNFIRIGLTVA